MNKDDRWRRPLDDNWEKLLVSIQKPIETAYDLGYDDVAIQLSLDCPFVAKTAAHDEGYEQAEWHKWNLKKMALELLEDVCDCEHIKENEKWAALFSDLAKQFSDQATALMAEKKRA